MAGNTTSFLDIFEITCIRSISYFSPFPKEFSLFHYTLWKRFIWIQGTAPCFHLSWCQPRNFIAVLGLFMILWLKGFFWIIAEKNGLYRIKRFRKMSELINLFRADWRSQNVCEFIQLCKKMNVHATSYRHRLYVYIMLQMLHISVWIENSCRKS